MARTQMGQWLRYMLSCQVLSSVAHTWFFQCFADLRLWLVLQSYNSIAMNLDFALITLKYAADVVSPATSRQHATAFV